MVGVGDFADEAGHHIDPGGLRQLLRFDLVAHGSDGGGKGMRLAFSASDVRESFEAVRREARASFGDDRVFIEKFVEQPRHIEIQVLGDTHGHVLHLNERDCSIQRRHQKVVEESPSPFVTPDMRARMGAQAVELAKAVGYHSAGTVEFIAGADRSFYFLEMNTRLQVEHPVTECVTGLDLVEWMIRIAAGERLPFTQEEIRLDGHAIETRFYAEDPYRGFLPSTGRLTRYAEPAPAPGLRIDSGVVEGSEISMFYDPMIAKVITHAPTRLEAADAQVAALDRFHVRGISHNADFLSALMQHPRFRAGEAVTTAFIAEEYPEGFAGAPGDARSLTHALALGALVAEAREREAAGIDHQLGTAAPSPRCQWVAELDGALTPIGIASGGEDIGLTIGDARLSIRNFRPPLAISGLAEAEIDGRSVAVQVDREKGHLRLTHAGRQHRFRLLAPRAAELQAFMIPKVPPDLSRYLLCPMPGLVVSIQVNEGDRVEAGQPLAVVEAMKMENILRAEKAGTVGKIHAQAGDSLAVDQVILEFA